MINNARREKRRSSSSLTVNKRRRSSSSAVVDCLRTLFPALHNEDPDILEMPPFLLLRENPIRPLLRKNNLSGYLSFRNHSDKFPGQMLAVELERFHAPAGKGFLGIRCRERELS